MFETLSLSQKIIVWAIPIIFAITVHEVAHGWVAALRGDKTAKMLGRLTLNPIKHIDLLGTIIVPLFLMIFSSFIFGWAKPVPVNEANLKHPRRDMALVAFAGPFANLVMAFIWAIILKCATLFGQQVQWLAIPLIYMGQAGIIINLVLMVLNLIPIPPLDGSRILYAVIPAKLAYKISRIEGYGFLILILLLVTGVLSMIIAPLIQLFMNIILMIFQF